MKLSGKLHRGCPSPQTSFPTLSGTSMSSKNPGRDLKDMKRLEGSGESWQGSRCLIFMKLSGKLHRGCPSPLTPFPTLSGTSMSSKIPGRDLEDRWSLDRVPDVKSWWKFPRSFQRMLPPVWQHLKVHHEPPCPPRFQEETQRIGAALDRFIRSLHVLQDSKIWHHHQEHPHPSRPKEVT